MKRALKRTICIALCAVLLLCAACAPANTETTPQTSPEATPQAETTTITVFAAASMKESLTEAAEAYKIECPNVTVVLNFESSGTLKTQIEEGAVCDLFISAAPKQMNELDGSKDAEVNPTANDFIEQGTRVNLLENKVVLVVPDGNPKEIASFDDLAEKLQTAQILLAMGNSDVPVGQYTQKILAYYELDEAQIAAGGAITYGSNVKEVTTQVAEASVDCGVVYATDAFSANLTVVDSATVEMCGQVIYPAAVLKTANTDVAKAFLAYLQTEASMKIFEAVGFNPAI